MDLHHLLLAGLPGALRFAPDTGHRSIGSSPASRHRGGYVVVRLRATSGHGSPLYGLTTIYSPPNTPAFTPAVGPQPPANHVFLLSCLWRILAPLCLHLFPTD